MMIFCVLRGELEFWAALSFLLTRQPMTADWPGPRCCEPAALHAASSSAPQGDNLSPYHVLQLVKRVPGGSLTRRGFPRRFLAVFALTQRPPRCTPVTPRS